MRNFYFLVVFFTLSLSAQNKPLEIRFDSITFQDTISGERKFTLNYHIENLTDKEISCFLNPKTLTPAHYGSMGTSPLFKLYQNNDVVNVSGILNNSLKKNTIEIPDFSNIKDETERQIAAVKFFKEKYNIDVDVTNSDINESDTDSHLSYKSKSLMSTIYTLKPKETKTFSQTFYWDKTRYYKHDDSEYYLDENSVFNVELYLVLLKEQYKETLLPEEFAKITADKNFIQGVFISNKMEIDFR